MKVILGYCTLECFVPDLVDRPGNISHTDCVACNGEALKSALLRRHSRGKWRSRRRKRVRGARRECHLR